MSKEKQIEDFENDLRECHTEFSVSDDSMDLYTDYKITAQNMIGKGWHKQSEGEWIVDDKYNKFCPVCGEKALYRASGTALATTFYQTKSNYCPNCGAKLVTKPKGGGE